MSLVVIYRYYTRQVPRQTTPAWNPRDIHAAKGAKQKQDEKTTCNPNMTSSHAPIPHQRSPNDVIHVPIPGQRSPKMTSSHAPIPRQTTPAWNPRDIHAAKGAKQKQDEKTTCNPKMTSSHAPIPHQRSPNDVIHVPIPGQRSPKMTSSHAPIPRHTRTKYHQNDVIHVVIIKEEDP